MARAWHSVSNTAKILRVAVGFVLAADAISVLAALAESATLEAAPIVLLVMGAVTVLLAVPVYVVLRLYRRETWRSCIAAGFILGAIAAACSLPSASGTVQIGQEMTVIAGIRTAAGWRMNAEAVGIAGGIGASAGAIFWATLRLLEHAAHWPRLGRFPLIVAVSLAITASWMIIAIPGLTMDRSCHNVLRDGRRSIAPVLFFTVKLAPTQWPRFQDTVERFAVGERWDIDESNDEDKKFSSLRFVNACSDSGTDVRFEGVDLPGPGWVWVWVFQPQGGNDWQEPARRLLASIEAGFPGELRRTLSNTEVQSPSSLLPQ